MKIKQTVIWINLGLVLMAVGFWLVEPRLALIVIGSLLFLCGIDAMRKGG